MTSLDEYKDKDKYKAKIVNDILTGKIKIVDKPLQKTRLEFNGDFTDDFCHALVGSNLSRCPCRREQKENPPHPLILTRNLKWINESGRKIFMYELICSYCGDSLFELRHKAAMEIFNMGVKRVERNPLLQEMRQAYRDTDVFKAATDFKIKYNKYEIYNLYLNSPRWYKKRIQRKNLDDNKCRICSASDHETTLQVHHKTYANIFFEPMEDLITLCEECHQKLHKKGEVI